MVDGRNALVQRHRAAPRRRCGRRIAQQGPAGQQIAQVQVGSRLHGRPGDQRAAPLLLRGVDRARRPDWQFGQGGLVDGAHVIQRQGADPHHRIACASQGSLQGIALSAHHVGDQAVEPRSIAP